MPLAGWAAIASISSRAATGEDVAAYRNKACPGSIPLLIMPQGGHLTGEAAERVALWDSEIIAFAYGCSPDAPGQADAPHSRLLLGRGKLILRDVLRAEQVADGDLLVLAALPGGQKPILPCQVTALRGVGGAWFEVEEIKPAVYAMGEPGHYERVYSYLVIGEKRAALIDTGMGIDNIEREVRKLTTKPILVINTHSHYDHIGDNHRFPQVALLETPNSVRTAQQGLSHADVTALGALDPGAFYRPWSVPPDFDPGGYRIPPFTIAHSLRDGETIDLGGKTLQVLHTPGHSADSVCLFDAVDRLLFTGDTFYPGTLYGHFDDSDFRDYLRSAEQLVAFIPQTDYVCPAHNLPRLDSGILKTFIEALSAVQTGQAIYRVLDEDPLRQHTRLRQYEWPRFSLLLPDRD